MIRPITLLNNLSGLRPINRLIPRSITLRATKVGVSSTRFFATSPPDINLLSNKRDTAKPLLSRKTFLVDYYKHLNDTNEIILYAHHNNITKLENKRIRSDLAKFGSKLNVIRNRLYEVYLRSEHEVDPANKTISQKNKLVRHPLQPLLNGPTAIITIPTSDPNVVAEILKILKTAQEKLFVVGAKIENNAYDVAKLDQYKDLPSKEQLQGQLAGLLTVLGGAGLVRTLEAGSNALYLTLKQHETELKGDDEQ